MRVVHVVNGEEAGVRNACGKLLPDANGSPAIVVIVQHQRLGFYVSQQGRNVVGLLGQNEGAGRLRLDAGSHVLAEDIGDARVINAPQNA